jgi:D-alanyl-D-alanine dipeptidase
MAHALSPDDLICLNLLTDEWPLEIDLAYAKPKHPFNQFGQIYHPQSLCWGHIDLLCVLLLAAQELKKNHGWSLRVYDCLRVTEAQQKMVEAPITQQNPHWLVEPRFLSIAGQGGHPRGMAIDIAPVSADGDLVDMGTHFDFFAGSTNPDQNPSHRQYKNFSDSVIKNRTLLEEALLQQAEKLHIPLIALSHEWWDFRLSSDYTNQFKPLSDSDLLPYQKTMSQAESLPPSLKQEQQQRISSRLAR